MGWFSQRRPTSLRTNFTFISIFMVVVGIVLSFMSLRSVNYKQTEGKIIQSAVSGTGKNRKLTIRYLYTVDQTNYDNDTIAYNLRFLRSESRLLNEYPVGRMVPVYYSITDPSYSVLEKGFSFGSFSMAILGALLLVVIRNFRR